MIKINNIEQHDEITVDDASQVPDTLPTNHRWAAIEEGGFFPNGAWRVMYRIYPCASSCNILVCAPFPSQHWWERYNSWLCHKLLTCG